MELKLSSQRNCRARLTPPISGILRQSTITSGLAKSNIVPGELFAKITRKQTLGLLD